MCTHDRQLRAPPTVHLSDEKQQDVNARIGSLMQLLAPMLSEGGGKVDLERWLPQKGSVGAEGPLCTKGGGDEESCGDGINEHAAVSTRAPSPPCDGAPGAGTRTPRVSKERFRRTTKERYELLQAEEAAAVKEWLSSRHSMSSEPLITTQCAHDGFAAPPPDDATQRSAGIHVMHMHTHMHAHMHMHVIGPAYALSSPPATGLEPDDETPHFEIAISIPERLISSHEDSPLKGRSPAFERRNDPHDRNLPQPTGRKHEALPLFPRFFGSKAKANAAISSTTSERPSPVRVFSKLSAPTELPSEVSSVGGRDIRLSGRCGVVENVIPAVFPQSLNGFIDTVLRQKPPNVPGLHTTQKIRLSIQNISRRGSRGEDESEAEKASKDGQPQQHWDVVRKHVKCGGHGASDGGSSGGGGGSVSSEDEDAEEIGRLAPSRRPSICL